MKEKEFPVDIVERGEKRKRKKLDALNFFITLKYYYSVQRVCERDGVEGEKGKFQKKKFRHIRDRIYINCLIILQPITISSLNL